MRAEHARHQPVQSSSRALQSTHDTRLRRDLCQRTSGIYSTEKQRRRAGGREAPSNCYRLMRPSTSSRVICDNIVMKMWQSIGRTGASALAEHGLQSLMQLGAAVVCRGAACRGLVCSARLLVAGGSRHHGDNVQEYATLSSIVMAGVCIVCMAGVSIVMAGLERACGCAKPAALRGANTSLDATGVVTETLPPIDEG